MELWVRSQDKERLIKVSTLFIEYNGDFDPTLHPYRVVTDKCINLAIYKTKERALEVLDEIQSLLMPKLILNSYDNITPEFSQNLTIMPISTDIKQFNSYVYEMPKE